MQLKHLLFTITFLLNLLLAGFAQEPRLLEHGGGVRTVEFSPVDASLVASAGESSIIKLWNLQNNTARTLRGHTAVVNSVAFSPDGELLASGSDDRTIKLWNVHNSQNIATFQHDNVRIKSLAFAPDGRILATGGDRHIKLWNVGNWTEIATLRHEAWARALVFSPDGQFLAAGKGHEGPGIVTVWNVQTRQVIATLEGDSNRIYTVAFSPNNRILASSGRDRQLKLWDVSKWELLRTVPHAGYYDIDFSPDGEMIAGTNNGSVSFWWVEDGANFARLPGPADRIHPVDFSHDGNFLAVGAEDGIVRIWGVNIVLESNGNDGLQILHVDTYLQQLLDANPVKGDNIPDPTPPPAVVRNFFQLDPFYEQWINVGGLPVIASAKVNPYALKEAAWLIRKMIGHRPDVLRAMAGNKTRFSVIAHTEIITEIPEYRNDAPPDFLIYRERGWGGSRQATVSSSEEDILNYQGSRTRGRYNVLIHEVAHGIHKLGFNTVDPTFDERLRYTYEAAMKKGLWNGTYASSDRKEYWAEGTQAWFHPNGGGSFDRFGDTRQALKMYDPGLTRLLTEIYGDSQWRYTLPETRNHLRHLLGFNPRETPTFNGWPELETLYRELSNPNSIGGGKWVNLKLYAPNQLSRLTGSNVHGDRTTIIFVNSTDADVLVYGVSSNATESFWTRIYPGRVRWTGSSVNKIWLVKDTSGRDFAVFQAKAQTGRALIGASVNKASHAARENVSRNDSQPRVLITQSQRPPMYWVDMEAGTIHRLVGAKVETFLPSVQNATSLAVDMTDEKLYWTEKTSNRTGRIRRAHLDGTNVQLVKNLTSVPHSITIDTVNDKLYLTNSWGKIQRLNFNGSNFEPNLITDLDDPDHLALDVAGGKLYWTEAAGQIRRANLNGSDIETLAADLGALEGIAIANSKLYWTEQTGENAGRIQRANLDGPGIQTLRSLRSVPLGITVDTTGRKLYWTDSQGKIRRASLNGKNVQDVATGLRQPLGIVLGIVLGPSHIIAAPAMVELPDETGLLVNYPNPFNPETWIPYQLSEPTEVTLTIYTVNGNVVRRLALGHQLGGIYHSKSRAAYWDGKNKLGEAVASGVYFYTLSAGDFTATRKMFIRK